MKKLLLLTALLIFACSSSGDGSDNSLDFDCPDFDGSTIPIRCPKYGYRTTTVKIIIVWFQNMVNPLARVILLMARIIYTPLCSKIIKAKHMEIKFATL